MPPNPPATNSLPELLARNSGQKSIIFSFHSSNHPHHEISQPPTTQNHVPRWIRSNTTTLTLSNGIVITITLSYAGFLLCFTNPENGTSHGVFL